MEISRSNAQEAYVQLRVAYYDDDLDADVTYPISIKTFSDVEEASRYAEQAAASQDFVPSVIADHEKHYKCWRVSKALSLDVATKAREIARSYAVPEYRRAA